MAPGHRLYAGASRPHYVNEACEPERHVLATPSTRAIPMPHRLRRASVLLAIVAACARSQATSFPPAAAVRPATDVPAQFELVTPSAASAPADGTCQSPVRDPRTGAELRFVRAVPGLGDYAVPEGSYGARAGELLRIDCRTWRAVGLVPR
jgi:hypothetical protein